MGTELTARALLLVLTAIAAGIVAYVLHRHGLEIPRFPEAKAK